MVRTAATREERLAWAPHFWSRVLKTETCWLWEGPRIPRGYGLFYKHGCNIYAHRFSWSLAHDTDIPEGMVVMHACDNPPCCRPDHLSIGTPKDNSVDCSRKQRCSRLAIDRGEEQHLSVLSRESVLEIKRGLLAGVHRPDLARRFGVTNERVYDIQSGRTWSWLRADGSEYSKDDLRGRNTVKRKVQDP